nr:alpha/beta hydrolase [Dictyobacter kobayashii]
MTSGEPLPMQVKAIIADCAYSSAFEILAYQGKRMYHLPAFPFVTLTSLVCKLRSGFFFEEASALKQVKKTTLPILFIHGEEDTFVPTAMVHHLYEACPTYKESFLVPDAGHGLAFTVDPDGYARHTEDFLARFVH